LLSLINFFKILLLLKKNYTFDFKRLKTIKIWSSELKTIINIINIVVVIRFKKTYYSYLRKT
jgi:hypothetical protein